MRICFADSAALLARLIDSHRQIAEHVEARLLNVQGKDLARRSDRAELERILASCFPDSSSIRHLAADHTADGFEAVPLERQSRQFDPVELIARAYAHWGTHRWPGRNARVSFARTLYSVYMLRQLEHLSMRIWDDGPEPAPGRLGQVQALLDRLNDAVRPVTFVRDARWLIQTAQGPLTRHLAPYFRIAAQVSDSFGNADGIEIHKAGAKLAGGHLRSQLRYRSRETGEDVDAPAVLMVTRNSNSMDVALLVQDLVPLLEAYLVAESTEQRIDLADAILQGVSADPQLLLGRLDLLGPYTMIEEVVVERAEDGAARYTPLGERHRAMLARYRGLIARAAPRLEDDAASFDPSRHPYSPLGLVYGFCADILSNLAMSPLVTSRTAALTLEDMFTSRKDCGQAEPMPDFDRSAEWAVQVFTRTVDALGTCPSNVQPARLFVNPQGQTATIQPDDVVSAQEHCITSDLQRALATGATAFPKNQIALDRREARFLASAESGGAWFGVSKAVLTVCASQRNDVCITDVPPVVVNILRVTCPELAVIP